MKSFQMNYMKCFYFYLVHMLPTFEINSHFFKNVIIYVSFPLRNFSCLLRVSKKH